jgi:hypothetical protein
VRLSEFAEAENSQQEKFGSTLISRGLESHGNAKGIVKTVLLLLASEVHIQPSFLLRRILGTCPPGETLKHLANPLSGWE